MPTQRIPQCEWERRKHRILEIYQNEGSSLLGDDGVIEKMKREGFDATRSQYETQFKKWKVRKYMSSQEWSEVIPERRRRGEKGPMEIAGMIIQPSRIEKAQRRYVPPNRRRDMDRDTGGFDSPDLGTAAVSSAGVEQMPAQGVPSEALECMDGIIGIQPFEVPGNLNGDIGTQNFPGLDPFENINMSTPEGLNSSLFHIHDDPTNNLIGSASQDQVYDDLILRKSAPPGNGLDTVSFAFGGSMETVETNDPQPVVWSPGISGMPLDIAALSHPYTSSPMSLPQNVADPIRRRWTDSLPSNEAVLTFVKADTFNEAFTPSPYCTISSTMRDRLVGQFVVDVAESIAINNREDLWQPRYAVFSPQALANIVFKQLCSGDQGQLSMLLSDDAFESRVYGRLVSTIINNFSGLENIPPSGILKFLSRHSSVQSKLMQFLRSSLSCAAKSLAENLFQAALEADNVDIAKHLLTLPLIDAKEMVCFHRGERCTPLEMAARVQSFEVFELLLSQEVDPDKQSDKLFILLGFYSDPELMLDQHFLYAIDAFIKAEVTIHDIVIERVLEDFVDPRLGDALIPAFAEQNPTEVFLGSFRLEDIVRHLEEQAVDMVKLIVRRCREFRGDQYLSKFHEEFNQTLELAVQRSDSDLVKHLLPFSSSTYEAIEIAIEKGYDEIRDIFLKEKPGLQDRLEEDKLVADFESGNWGLINILEERGVLNRLNSGRITQLATTALRMEKPTVAAKLLDIGPDADKEKLRDVLCAALTHDCDQFALDLIMAAEVNIFGYKRPSPISIAIAKRKWHLLQVILEYHFHPAEMTWEVGIPSVLEVAIESGNDSILEDVLEAWSRSDFCRFSVRLLESAIKRGGRDLIWRFLRTGPQNIESMKSALIIAVRHEDALLLQELVSFGAPVEDEYALEEAVTGHPSMIEPLLEQFLVAYPRGKIGYGIMAMQSAIRHYKVCPRGFDVLIASKLVDLNYSTPSIREVHATISFLGKVIATLKERGEVEGSDIRLIQALLDAGTNPNGTTSEIIDEALYYRQTALLDAIDTGSTEIVRLLLQHGARINEPARYGLRRTPLQKAAEIGSLEIIRLLLERGADVNAKPAMNGGATALQLAAIQGNCVIAMTLIEHGARFDIPPPRGRNGRWPLEGAAEHSRLDMIQLLWYANKGQFDDKQCQKAMHLAKYNGHLGCRDQIDELMAARMWDIDQFLEGAEDVGGHTGLDIPQDVTDGQNEIAGDIMT